MPDKRLAAIEHHLLEILKHRDEPTDECGHRGSDGTWKPGLTGCAEAMVHDADDALQIVRELRAQQPKQPSGLRPRPPVRRQRS